MCSAGGGGGGEELVFLVGARFQRGLMMMGKGRRLKMDGGNGEF